MYFILYKWGRCGIANLSILKKKVESAISITFNGFSVIKMIDDF